MTTFYDWLYLGQTQYDPDDLNKREKELAQLAWEEAQTTIPEGWKLVPKEPTQEMFYTCEHIFDHGNSGESPFEFFDRKYKDILEAAPKFGEEE